jgi:hypothetical protein
MGKTVSLEAQDFRRARPDAPQGRDAFLKAATALATDAGRSPLSADQAARARRLVQAGGLLDRQGKGQDSQVGEALGTLDRLLGGKHVPSPRELAREKFNRQVGGFLKVSDQFIRSAGEGPLNPEQATRARSLLAAGGTLRHASESQAQSFRISDGLDELAHLLRASKKGGAEGQLASAARAVREASALLASDRPAALPLAARALDRAAHSLWRGAREVESDEAGSRLEVMQNRLATVLEQARASNQGRLEGPDPRVAFDLDRVGTTLTGSRRQLAAKWDVESFGPR